MSPVDIIIQLNKISNAHLDAAEKNIKEASKTLNKIRSQKNAK